MAGRPAIICSFDCPSESNTFNRKLVRSQELFLAVGPTPPRDPCLPSLRHVERTLARESPTDRSHYDCCKHWTRIYNAQLFLIGGYAHKHSTCRWPCIGADSALRRAHPLIAYSGSPRTMDTLGTMKTMRSKDEDVDIDDPKAFRLQRSCFGARWDVRSIEVGVSNLPMF